MCGIISMKGGANMNHLKELRAQKGYTQSELGKMLGVSASTIGMYEQGRREPDSSYWCKPYYSSYSMALQRVWS